MNLLAVRDFIRKHGLLEEGDTVLAGVSGGPDSLALLFILRALAKEMRLRLRIAHLDHGLRPESAAEARYVAALADKLKIPAVISRAELGKTAKKGSLEEACRNARLDFLLRAAKDAQADKIALGHNLDDQAETVLMRILRGTGLYGLAGILPKRVIYGHTIIRPLLGLRRREIEAYLKRKKVIPLRDASNAEDVFLRNRMRRKLLPFLEKEYNRNIKQALANLAEGAAYDYEFLGRCARRAMGKKGSRIALARLKKAHPAIRRIIFRQAIAAAQGDTRRITFQHIREIEDLLWNRPVGSVVNLPRGLTVTKKILTMNFSAPS
jgi:tRNA(Ile)-lysidine synthase